MEITEINIIRDFEAGMKCLQNPSLFSRFSPLSALEKVPQVYSFWKWGALILAIVAAFTGIIKRIGLLIVQDRVNSLVSSAQALDDEDFDFSDDDISSSAMASDGEDEFESTSSFEDHRDPDDDIFRVAGNSNCYWEDRWGNGDFKLRRRNRFSWSDFSAGKSVVQLWECFRLGLDFEEDSDENEISFWDLNRDVKISSDRGCQVPATAISSPAVIPSAEMNDRHDDGVVLGVYDTRVGPKMPVIYAAWQPRQGKVVGLDSVAGELTIGDMRNVKVALENLTESDGETWWDADGVIVQDKTVNK